MIEVEGLHKKFGARRRWPRWWIKPEPTRALSGVSLKVGAGELVTLLGPNGAGKTTLLKVISTLVVPDQGRVKVAGIDALRSPRRAREAIGYVLADERSFFWRLSCRDNLRFFAALYGLSRAAVDRRIAELSALVGLGEHLDREFADLSTGQRQRLAIARGLIADPPVLLFDEATRSLDPARAARLRRVIREILVERAQKAVLFATHDLEEARALSDRVVLMAAGRIAAEGAFGVIEPKLQEVFSAEAAAEEAELRRWFPEAAR